MSVTIDMLRRVMETGELRQAVDDLRRLLAGAAHLRGDTAREVEGRLPSRACALRR